MHIKKLIRKKQIFSRGSSRSGRGRENQRGRGRHYFEIWNCHKPDHLEHEWWYNDKQKKDANIVSQYKDFEHNNEDTLLLVCHGEDGEDVVVPVSIW